MSPDKDIACKHLAPCPCVAVRVSLSIVLERQNDEAARKAVLCTANLLCSWAVWSWGLEVWEPHLKFVVS